MKLFTTVRQIFLLAITRKIHHLIAWVFLFFIFLSISQNPIVTLVFIAFLMGLVYINFFHLIPNYLSKNFLLYTLLLIGLCALLAPINAVVIYFISKGEIEESQIGLYFLIYFMISGSSTVMKIVKDWYYQQNATKEIEKTSIQTELKFLKSQINPHFLFNTLNNLYALTLKKSDNAPEIVIKLSEMLRYMLYECNEKRVPLRKEIKYIQNYIDLEKLRQGDRSNINLTINGEIRDQMISPLMFIPFLENSFKHGLNRGITEGYVNIVLDVEGDQLRFFMENSKPSASPSPAQPKIGGIGLINVRRRLKLIYPKAHELVIDDRPDAYSVKLELNLDR